MPARAHDEESWRRSTLVTHHMDHPPQVKALVDELYAVLSETGPRDYEAMIEAEYAVAGEHVLHGPCGGGVVSTIAAPVRGERALRLTHLVYGGCTEHEIRQDLIARGLGSLGVTWVYPPDTVLPGEADGLPAG
jgi:hypothetical protein